jgi:hypothetical protein
MYGDSLDGAYQGAASLALYDKHFELPIGFIKIRLDRITGFEDDLLPPLLTGDVTVNYSDKMVAKGILLAEFPGPNPENIRVLWGSKEYPLTNFGLQDLGDDLEVYQRKRRIEAAIEDEDEPPEVLGEDEEQEEEVVKRLQIEEAEEEWNGLNDQDKEQLLKELKVPTSYLSVDTIQDIPPKYRSKITKKLLQKEGVEESEPSESGSFPFESAPATTKTNPVESYWNGLDVEDKKSLLNGLRRLKKDTKGVPTYGVPISVEEQSYYSDASFKDIPTNFLDALRLKITTQWAQTVQPLLHKMFELDEKYQDVREEEPQTNETPEQQVAREQRNEQNRSVRESILSEKEMLGAQLKDTPEWDWLHSQYSNLLWHLVHKAATLWQFNKRDPVRWEVLPAVAEDAFMKAISIYDPVKSAISTHLYTRIQGPLLNAARSEFIRQKREKAESLQGIQESMSGGEGHQDIAKAPEAEEGIEDLVGGAERQFEPDFLNRLFESAGLDEREKAFAKLYYLGGIEQRLSSSKGSAEEKQLWTALIQAMREAGFGDVNSTAVISRLRDNVITKLRKSPLSRQIAEQYQISIPEHDVSGYEERSWGKKEKEQSKGLSRPSPSLERAPVYKQQYILVDKSGSEISDSWMTFEDMAKANAKLKEESSTNKWVTYDEYRAGAPAITEEARLRIEAQKISMLFPSLLRLQNIPI